MKTQKSKFLSGLVAPLTSIRRSLVCEDVRGPLGASLGLTQQERAHSAFILSHLSLGLLPLLVLPLLLVWPQFAAANYISTGFALSLFSGPALYLAMKGNLPRARHLSVCTMLAATTLTANYFPAFGFATIGTYIALGLFALQNKSMKAGLTYSALIVGLTLWTLSQSNWQIQTGQTQIVFCVLAVGFVALLTKLSTPNLPSSDKSQMDLLAKSTGVLVLRHSEAGKITDILGGLNNIGMAEDFTADDQAFLNRVHVSDRVTFLNAISVALMSSEPQRACFNMIGEHGHRFLVELSCERVFAPSGEAELVSSIRDVSEFARLKSDLENAERAIEQSDQSSTRFLATMSHELRTPLNAIIGFSDLLRQGLSGKLSDLQREQVTDIHKAGHHLLNIVNATLDMSKLDAGRYELRWHEFNLAEAFQSAASIVSASLPEKKVSINYEIAAGLDVVTADEKAITQILINLLSNAVKFSHCGAVVELSAERDHTGFKLIVADEGVGMSQYDSQQICKPYTQLSNDYSRQANGTGLGMAIVSGLVKLHHGKLDIKSQLGKGTKMIVHVPGYEFVRQIDATSPSDNISELEFGKFRAQGREQQIEGAVQIVAPSMRTKRHVG